MALKISSGRFRLRYVVLAGLVALVTGTLAVRSCLAADEEPGGPPLMAREYKELREYEGREIVDDKRNRSKALEIIRDGQFDSDDEKKLLDNHLIFRVAELTWLENLTELPKKRKFLKTQDLQSGKVTEPGSPHDFVNKRLLELCLLVALDPAYHPAVRYNCMLLVSALDQQEPEPLRGEGSVPYAPALPKLLAAMKDVTQMDAVRIAALLGVMRHTQLTIAPNERGPTAVALVDILNTGKPGQAGTLVGNTWMRRRAAQALGFMAGNKWAEANRPEVADALKTLMEDPNADLLARCDAAFSLGTLDKTALAKDKVQGYALAAAKIAAKAAISGPVAATGVADPGKANVEFLTYAFNHIQTAFKGNGPNRGLNNSAALDDATKRVMTEVNTRLSKMVTFAGDHNLADDARNEKLAEVGTELDAWLKNPLPADK